jgi:hypothetical protein
MDEEVKITVVATGFDDTLRRAEPMMRREEVKSEVKRPIFAPKVMEEEPERDLPEDQDELEIPAFIRKKIK